MIEIEAKRDSFNTLEDVILLLLVYSEVTAKEKPAKKIDILSILVEITETVLK